MSPSSDPSNVPSDMPAADRIDRLCDAFEREWQGGKVPSLEEFLNRIDALHQAKLFRELLRLDLDYRNQTGTLIAHEEYIARFPSQKAVIAEVFEALPPAALTLGSFHTIGETAEETLVESIGGAAGLNRKGWTPVGVIADYELLVEIARGGMGVVYLARQRRLNRLVAVKMILSGKLASEEAVKRFYLEAESAAKLEHPHIVPIYEVGEYQKQHFYSMAFVDGPSLSKLLQSGPLLPREAADLLAKTADAVQYAHEQGIIHRDLKPANILLAPVAGQVARQTGSVTQLPGGNPTERVEVAQDAAANTPVAGGSSPTRTQTLKDQTPRANYIPKVTDFGVAKQTTAEESGMTNTGAIVGTPSYMPPEQAAGRIRDISPASDVYSLGAILYETLVGRPPFRAANIMETLRQVMEAEPVKPRMLDPQVDRDLETICLKCLEKDPRRRYASAGKLSDDLRRFLMGEPVRARPIGPMQRSWRWCRRKPLAASLVALTFILAMLLPLGFWYRALFLTASERLRSAESRRELNDYYSAMGRVREAANRPEHGWTWDALGELSKMTAKRPDEANEAELRSLAADVIGQHDLRKVGAVASGIDANALAFSPDGTRLAIAQRKNGVNCLVQVFDVASQKLQRTLGFGTLMMTVFKGAQGQTKLQEGFTALAWSPDGRWLSAGTRFGNLVVWDMADASSTERSWKAHEEKVWRIEFSPDGKSLTSCAEKLKRWDVEQDWKVIADSELAVDDFVTLPKGDVFLARTSSGIQAFVIGAPSTAILNWPKGVDCDRGLALSPDGRFLACSNPDHRVFIRRSHSIEVVAHSWLVDPNSEETSVDKLAFDPSGEVLLGLCSDHRLRFWDVGSGRPLLPDLAAPLNDTSFSVSPKGDYLAMTTQAEQRQTELFEWRRPLATVRLPQGGIVQAADLAATSNRLAVVATQATPEQSECGTELCQWDLESRLLKSQTQVLFDVRYRWSAFARAVAWNPVAETIAWTTIATGLTLSPTVTAPAPTRFLTYLETAAPIEITTQEFSKGKHNTFLLADASASGGEKLEMRRSSSLKSSGHADVDLSQRGLEKQPAGWALVASLRTHGSTPLTGQWKKELSVRKEGKSVVTNTSSYSVFRTFPGGNQWNQWIVLDRPWPQDFSPENGLKVSLDTAGDPKDRAGLTLTQAMLFPVRKQTNLSLEMTDFGPLAWSPDGARLWGIGNSKRLLYCWEGNGPSPVASWDNRISDITTGLGAISCLSVGARWVVAGCFNGHLAIFNAQQRGVLTPLSQTKILGGEIRAVALHPAEPWAVVATQSGRLELRRISEGTTLAEIPNQRASVESLCISHQGDWLFAADDNGLIRIFQIDASHSPPRIKPWLTLNPRSGPLHSVKLAKDGRWLIAVPRNSRAVQVWDMQALHSRLTSFGL